MFFWVELNSVGEGNSFRQGVCMDCYIIKILDSCVQVVDCSCFGDSFLGLMDFCDGFIMGGKVVIVDVSLIFDKSIYYLLIVVENGVVVVRVYVLESDVVFIERKICGYIIVIKSFILVVFYIGVFVGGYGFVVDVYVIVFKVDGQGLIVEIGVYEAFFD